MNRQTRRQALQQVQQQMKACRLCQAAGFDITPPAVFSGQVGAKIMVIGQAPGVTECQTGRPFNAGSGSRLFAWLAGAGLEEAPFRAQQYLTSVTKCFPGRGRGASGDRAPTRTEQKLCRPYLQVELALVRPAIILPVGRLAIEWLLGPAGSLEQAVGERFAFGQAAVFPLPHPSGASRWHQAPENRRRIERALAGLKAELGRAGLAA